MAYLEVPVQEVIVHCRGPCRLMSGQMPALLRKRCLTAHTLDVGPPDWRIAGLSVKGR